MKIHLVFHVSLLRKYCPRTKQFTNPHSPHPPPIIVNGEEEYEADRILQKRICGRQTEYLIKWKVYPLYEATWESEKNIANTSLVLQAFERNDDVVT